MKWLSELLLPVSKNVSGRIRDTGFARMARGGFAVWNPNDATPILTPEGKTLYDHAVAYLLGALATLNPRRIDTCGSSRGALDAAVRVVRRARDLPLLMCEVRRDRLELLGLHADAEEAAEMCASAVRAAGGAFRALGPLARRVDRLDGEGYAVDIVCRAQTPLRGEDGFFCPKCQAVFCADTPCRHVPPESGGELAPLETVATPDCSAIEDLCAYLNIAPNRTVKCMFYTAKDLGLVAVLLRGDRQVCLEKLRAALRGVSVRPAEAAELSAVMGDSAGYMGPIGLPKAVTLLADCGVENVKGAVVGANKAGFHYTGACWGRDFSAENIADLTFVRKDDVCPACGERLKPSPLRRLARFRPVDPTCAAEPSLTFFNEQSKVHAAAWSAEIDLTALLAEVAACSSVWPRELAPFNALVFWEKEEPPFSPAPLFHEFEKAGLSVLACDRAVSSAEGVSLAQNLMVPLSVFCTVRDGSPFLRLCAGNAEREAALEELPSLLRSPDLML